LFFTIARIMQLNEIVSTFKTTNFGHLINIINTQSVNSNVKSSQ